MTVLHRVLGVLTIGLFTLLCVWGVALRIARRDDTPTAMWATQHWTENVLVVQTVLGVVLLIMGRRVMDVPLAWLHYLYGSVFPLVAVVGGRIASLRRETREYVGLTWGAFFALGLTLRALQTACGAALADISRCLGG